jgi:DNA-binding CsgD family transcriptional regulator
MMLDGVVGTMDDVSRFIDLALEDCGDADDVRAQALDWKALIHVGMLVAGVPQALEWAEESLALGRKSGQGRDWCLVHSGRRPEGPLGTPHLKRHIWRGQPKEAEERLVGAIATSEAEGRFRPAMSMRIHLVDLLTRAGRIGEARGVLAILDDADLASKESPDEEIMHALIEAQAGDAAAARDWAALARHRAAEFGHVWIGLDSRKAVALAALVEGGLEEAEVELRACWEHAVAAGVLDPGIFPVAPDLAETLALLGRHDDARRVLSWLGERAEEQNHPWGSAMLARSTALLGLVEGTAEVAHVVATADQAATRLADLGLGHDAARTRLIIGSALRRKRQWGSARAMIERARADFDDLGADGWAGVARTELTKVGGRQKRTRDELTPAELTISRLAAEGLSNKQIARRTNVSINTVEAHLTRAYAKLDVRSRSQLAARLPG